MSCTRRQQPPHTCSFLSLPFVASSDVLGQKFLVDALTDKIWARDFGEGFGESFQNSFFVKKSLA